MKKKYKAALQEFPPFAKTVEQLLPELSTAHEQLTAQVTAPVLFAYVWHVLMQAERIGLRRLYFLARDGYVMLEIAKEIARVCPVSAELRYLYCSRAALRMPSYHRLECDEVYELLLHRGTNLTIDHILDRASLTDVQRQSVFEELSVRPEDAGKQLTEPEFSAFCEKLRSSGRFIRMVMENSSAAYADTIGYFRQEGLTDGTAFGIVDTGWTGSMQRSLRQLSEDISPVNGFYFGMFARPKATADGVYHTWYFSADSSISVRTKFNNNLFECMCAAPHGMTVGYRQENEYFVPVCREAGEQGAALARTQVEICRRFAQLCAPQISYSAFSQKQMHHISRRLLTALMYCPDSEEAEVFGQFTFCDDVTEAYAEPLAKPHMERVLREHLLLHRIIRKLRGIKPSEELFWSYGTLALSSLPCRQLHRPILRMWDVGRCIVDKVRHISG